MQQVLEIFKVAGFFPDSPRKNRIQKCEISDAFAKFRKSTIILPVLLCYRSGLAEVSVFLDYDATSLGNWFRKKPSGSETSGITQRRGILAWKNGHFTIRKPRKWWALGRSRQ